MIYNTFMLRMTKSIIVFILPMILSCSTSTSSSIQTMFEVSFDTSGGNEISPIIVPLGQTIPQPDNPEKEGFFFLNWYHQDPLIPWNFDQIITMDLTLQARWEIEITTPAVLRFDLDIPIDYVVREQYETALMSVSNTQTPWITDNVGLALRGRGNGGSWGYDQKGYRLKFNEEIPLLGEVSSRHWVLTPGGHDFGLIRNHAAFSIAETVMTEIPYVSSSRYVEVYFNDQYHGLYNLFEHVRVDEGRIDIDSEYGVLDTGYLLELDSYATGREGIDYFYVSGFRYPFTVKSPEPDEWEGVISETEFREQISYIQNELQSFVSAIYGQNEIETTQSVDFGSLVDMYILQELFKNTDSGWSSFYLFRPAGGKWTFAPPWDFDFSAGISRGDWSTTDLYVGETILYYSDYTSNELYIELMRQSWFVNAVKSRYRTIAAQIETTVHTFASIQIKYEEAFQRHQTRWYWYSIWQSEQNYMMEWLIERNQWLLNWAS